MCGRGLASGQAVFLLLEDDLLPASDDVTLIRRRLRRAAHDLADREAQGARTGRGEGAGRGGSAQEGAPDIVYLEFCYESCKPSRPGQRGGAWRDDVPGRSEGVGQGLGARGGGEGGGGKEGYTPARYPSCTAAVLYSRGGAQRILEAARPIFDAYDQMLPRLIADGTVRAAVATPPLFYQDGYWGSDAGLIDPHNVLGDMGSRLPGEEREQGGGVARGHATKHVLRHHVLKPSCASMRPAMRYLQTYFLLGRREHDAEGQHPRLHLKDFSDFVATLAGTATAAALDTHAGARASTAAADDAAEQGAGRGLTALVRLEVYLQSMHDSIYDEAAVSRRFTVLLGQLLLWW